MDAITFWCFVIIYFLAFVLVIFITLLAAECLKNARKRDTINAYNDSNGNFLYDKAKCSHLGINGIHTV